jgi:Flp pilus assembly pilin Flp
MPAKKSPRSKVSQATIERQANMKNLILKLKALRDTRGQDLIEYALMAGFVAVAAGAIMPNISSSISTIFSQVASVMTQASSS